MLYQALDLERIIQVFVVQGFIILFFIYIAFSILRRGKKRLNLIFSFSYISIALALFINIIYALILYEPFTTAMAYITHFFLGLGPVFLLIFNIIVLKSEKVIGQRNQLLLVIGYSLVLAFMFLFIPFNGITINAATDWKSVWTLEFYIFFLTILTICTTIPNFYTSIIVYLSFQSTELKKKWRYFLIGLVGLYFYMYGAFTANYLDIPTFRVVMSFIALTDVIFLYLMYYGVGKQLDEKQS
ncbi:MAG: hypothetical protein GF317_07725 [Candidatus Lokiarchaeota archaeon]|nr:hypothetical protein [Candidatus Lokiarchaeota archaeon]MBD3199601.1 hypothetical protein [Candidatus Lokiarchaeota archaeon]